MLAATVPLLAHADTSWVRGGNWADDGDNFQDGIIYPTGITSTTTTTQAAAVADTIAADDISIGINFVRIGINPATVTGDWSVVQAYVNELIHDGLTVDLACWDGSDKDGVINNFSAWEIMWQTVDGVYHANNSVYYEPFNEPHGYTAANLLNNVYAPFLGLVTKNQSHIILDGTGYSDHVAAVGSDSRFNSCLLGVHDYAFWDTSLTTEAQWESHLSGEVAGYQSRTIMTETGAPATTGLDYNQSANNTYISSIRGFCIQCRAWPMGIVYWPSHRAGDTYRLFSSSGGAVNNQSMINELQYGWDFFTSAEAWGICDFNVIGKTDYSVFRPSLSKWYVVGGAQTVWGTNGDIAVPADYAGIGQAQFAVWRPSNGDWYVYPNLNPTHFGTSGDIPVPADYLGNGQAQYAVFRPSNGTWYINGGSIVQWGTNGDIPVPGYYNGDGHADIAVFRPSNSKWYVYGGQQTVWGTNGDVPVPGDYNSSGKTQLATWRPSNGKWYPYGGQITAFGTNGDIPVPGDYTGSGFTQLATWDPSSFTWNVNGVGQTNWGTTGDVPLSLPYAIRHYCFGYSN